MSRGSTRRRAAIVVGVVAALGGAVWLTTFRSDPAREPRAAATAFLTRLSDGRASEAYAQAADELHAEVERGAFLLEAEELGQAAGKLRGIRRLIRAEVHDATDEADTTRAELVADVAYERKTLRVTLGLERRPDGWRVRSFRPEYPADFWAAPDPAALITESTTLATWLAAGELTPIYARLYPDARASWPPARFEADVGARRAACGTLRPDAPRVAQAAAESTLVEIPVACDKGAPFVVRLTWSWRRGQWRLLGLSLGT